MQSTLLSNTAFRLQRIVRAQPAISAALVLSFCAVMAASLLLSGLRAGVVDAAAEQQSLQRSLQGLPANAAEAPAVASVSLQPFNSAQMVQVLNDVAAQGNVAINEVTFTLDETNGQPFLRYRAAFSITTKYLSARRFIDGMHAGLPDVSLDSISCAREAISAQVLKCDLVVAAFYRRAGHG